MTTSTRPGAALSPTPEMEHDIVRATQHIYRTLLDALSHPGEVFQIIPHPAVATYGSGAHPCAAAILLTLADHEVSMHVDSESLRAELEALLGRVIRIGVTTVDRADFVVTDDARPDLISSLQPGSLEYPEDGATLIITVPTLDGDGIAVMMHGPGIPDTLTRTLPGLTTDALDARNDVVSGYPTGIDLLIVDDEGRVLALPRTTVVTRDGGA